MSASMSDSQPPIPYKEKPMTAASTSRRSTAGIVFAIAGVLLALVIVRPLAGVGLGGSLHAIAFLVIAVSFAILVIGAVNATLTKVLLIAAMNGWALLVLNEFGLGLPAVLT